MKAKTSILKLKTLLLTSYLMIPNTFKNHLCFYSTEVPDIVEDKPNEETRFDNYPFFYFQKILISNQDLEDHKPVCYTIEDFAPFPCDVCGAQCPLEEDLARHRTTYHELGTFNERFGMDIFWCDICPITCINKSDLDVHIRCCHEED